MLLKWLFTLLAILWLIQALKPYFAPSDPPPRPRRNEEPANTKTGVKNTDDDGEYIDYEEIK